jgi:two-component system, NtrC family, nitrogen regulation response regulator GlnG
MKPIWIVDDDQSIRFVLEKALLREQLPTRSFTNQKDVLSALDDAGDEEGPQILVSDIRMPGGTGLELLEKVKARYPALPVIIMTAFSDLDSAVSAFQGGAFEYLPKPFDLPKAVELIRRAVEESQREEVAEERMASTPEMLGQAPAMQDVFRAIGRLSQSNVTVLITGESGSGKELVAHALHKHSPRANGPFVAINTSCSGMNAAPLPVRRPCAGAASSRPKLARSFWMRLATCPSICRRACCACSAMAIFTALAATVRSRPMCV